MDLIGFRPYLVLLVLLNAIVLLGQLWPAGGPPFAHYVNVLFLALTLLTFVGRMFGAKRTKVMS